MKTTTQLRDKITEYFVELDDFHKEFIHQIQELELLELASDKKRRNRSGNLSVSEMMSIIVLFQTGHFTNFKHFYTQYVCVHLADLFPDLVCYDRFVQLQERCIIPLLLYLKNRGLGKSRGINFIDSTCIHACHIKREKQHKVLKERATKGKSTLGWFYGFKLHLIINDRGEILSFYMTRANVDDRNLDVISHMTKNVFGKIFGDKGYISKALSELLFEDGIQLITKVRKNMKQQNLSDIDAILLRKRALIESVNDELKNICKLQHTRHRSSKGFMLNTIAALTAYSFLPKKPSLNITPIKTNQLFLQMAA